MLSHPVEGGKLIKRLEKDALIFFITLIDKKNSENNNVYKLLQKDLGSSFIPIIINKWKGTGPAFSVLIDQIKKLPKNSLIFKIDSLDIVTAKNPKDGFIDIFRSFNADIVLSGELGLRPTRRWLGKRNKTFTDFPTQANGGFYGGRKEALVKFMYNVCKNSPPILNKRYLKGSDQTAIQEYLLTGTPGFNGKWVIDTKSKLVHTGAYETRSSFTFLPNSQVWHNKYNRMLTSFFYHAPGSSAKQGFFDAVKHVRKKSPLGNCDDII